ncbi:glycogenin [Lentinula aciculospora]|uniref:glycogenin glucosyltransferase n=1 Tax=Lentinula aciculospora TaxID=153920 RepID=A0A9W9ALL7_9AGAR|nr:glycogenin [Lentinula aciculospora]
MASPYAFVTLLTSDHYLPGALTLAAALREVHPSPPISPEVDFQTVCLVTPETLDVSTIKLLRKAFDVVIGVELIAQNDEEGLKLLGRPDLNEVLTKLHVFRLIQYQKIIFLDADVLPIQPLSHLFTIPHEFSAAPDVGWPDIFNSGVLVLSPGEEKFSELRELLKAKGSWDGGDQGTLNEWRGNNWNRLSFTYNTTPTAAYTYAPAYERFGKQISAIHFIGPNKPWKSIQYRAPFHSLQSQQQSETNQRAYDYDSLVDKWFDVYDTHYRADSIVPETNFEVMRYVSAWDEQNQKGAPAPVSSQTGVLGLEELRRLAIQGINSAGLSSQNRTGEGEYKSMPLEGRVDLMRPQPPSKRLREEKEEVQRVLIDTQQYPTQYPTSSVRGFSPRTPGPNEIPPSPHPQPIPLPPTPSFTASDHSELISHYDHQQPGDNDNQPSTQQQQFEHHFNLPPSQEQPSPEFRQQPQPPSYLPPSQEQLSNFRHQSSPRPFLPPSQEQLSDFRHQSPPRPSSPPKLLWNPAIEPPPNTAPPLSAFPSDTYFQNIWDQPPSKHHDRTHPHTRYTTSPAPDSGAFFEPPPLSQIPERIQDNYKNVIGDVYHDSSARLNPNLNKVKPVFPWEDKPRSKPGRVFPASDAVPPALFAPPMPVKELERSLSPAPVQEVFSLPSKGLPATLAYANAWDTVPSIQRYASRLVRPPPPQPAPLPFDSEDYRHYRRGNKSWDERTDASSRDGDDEDNTDTDDDEPVVSRLADSDNETSVSGSSSRTRSRRSSLSASYGGKSKKKEYRVRGVQTISPEMREQAVQVSILVDSPKVSNTPQLLQDQRIGSPKKSTLTLQTGSSKRPQWAPSSVASVLPPVVSGGRGGSPVNTTGIEALNSHFSSSSDALSPREFGSNNSPTAIRSGPPARSSSSSTLTPSNANTIAAPATAMVQRSSGYPQVPSAQPLGPLRHPSNDSTITSPPSSAGPLSPHDGQSIASVASPRRAARVFDPARGVELFKRGSEEVLARFLKMSSWEEESSPQR